MGQSVAFVGHSFHQKTRSEEFLVSLLERHGFNVQRFWCDEWRRGSAVDLKDVADFPLVIMFQALCSSRKPYSRCMDNITFVPMLDDYVRNRPGALATLGQDTSRWQALGGAKVLNFSRTLHEATLRMGLFSKYFQVHVEPAPAPCLHTGLHGFFWLRHGDWVSVDCVRRLMGATPFASLHIHAALDPGAAELAWLDGWPEGMALSHSSWFEDKAQYTAMLRQKNVFFAPRAVEGIGFSFLEGLSLGQCVVAPDFPTMNEYIRHGENGLLYDLHTPCALDFRDAAQLGARAWEDVVAGRAQWKRDEERIVEYIATSNRQCYASWHQVPLAPKVPLKHKLKSIRWLRPLWKVYSRCKPWLLSKLGREP